MAPSAWSSAASSCVAPGQLLMNGPEPASTRIVRPWPRRSRTLAGAGTETGNTLSGARSAPGSGTIPASINATCHPFASTSRTYSFTNRCGVRAAGPS